MTRSFIAIDLPDEVVKQLLFIQKEIDSLGLVRGKYTEQENFHLTLKFLGDISRSEVEAVKEKLANIKFEPFKVNLGKLGVFNEEFIRIIWVSLEGEALWELQKKIDESLEDIFPKEFNFMAHITLARPKYVEDKETLIEEIKKINFEKINFEIDKVSFKKSELTKIGARYSNLLEANSIVK